MNLSDRKGLLKAGGLFASHSFTKEDIDKGTVSAQSLFVLGDKWQSKSQLHNALNDYARCTQFTLINTASCYFRCNRFGKTTVKRSYTNSAPLKCGCEWQVKIKSLVNTSVPIKSGLVNKV